MFLKFGGHRGDYRDNNHPTGIENQIARPSGNELISNNRISVFGASVATSF
jgi:hypothetical protein